MQTLPQNPIWNTRIHHMSHTPPVLPSTGIPRDKQLTKNSLLICQGLAEDMQMPVTGKRSMLGSLWGPVNDPNLNGTHPALLAALRCNSDVQVPFRIPVTAATHQSQYCAKRCHEACRPEELVREAQTTQAAQAGYACDYQNKRLPIAIHELKDRRPAVLPRKLDTTQP